MKNKRSWIAGGAIGLFFALFFGCGQPAGEREYRKAMDAWEHGDLVRARSLLEKSIRKTVGNEKKSLSSNQLGIILWRLGKPDEAIAAFSNSCELCEDVTEANLNLGIALFQAGRMDAAELEFSKILRERPGNATARSYAVLIDMTRKDWPKASKTLTDELRARPANPVAQNELAIGELHLNRSPDAAVARLKQLAAAYPDYAPAAYNLAVIYDQWIGDAGNALQWYRRYLQKAGAENAFAEQARKAVARLSGPKPETARPDPSTATRLMAEGARLHQAGKYRDAIAAYRQAIQADPTQKTAFYNMGLAHYALKDYAQTATCCADALRIDPKFADARYMLSLAYFQQKKWNDAEHEALALKQIDATRGDEMLKHIATGRNP